MAAPASASALAIAKPKPPSSDTPAMRARFPVRSIASIRRNPREGSREYSRAGGGRWRAGPSRSGWPGGLRVPEQAHEAAELGRIEVRGDPEGHAALPPVEQGIPLATLRPALRPGLSRRAGPDEHIDDVPVPSIGERGHRSSVDVRQAAA